MNFPVCFNNILVSRGNRTWEILFITTRDEGEIPNSFHFTLVKFYAKDDRINPETKSLLLILSISGHKLSIHRFISFLTGREGGAALVFLVLFTFQIFMSCLNFFEIEVFFLHREYTMYLKFCLYSHCAQLQIESVEKKCLLALIHFAKLCAALSFFNCGIVQALSNLMFYYSGCGLAWAAVKEPLVTGDYLKRADPQQHPLSLLSGFGGWWLFSP